MNFGLLFRCVDFSTKSRLHSGCFLLSHRRYFLHQTNYLRRKMKTSCRDIRDIESFSSLQSWEKLQTTIQNMDGRNFSVDRTYPYIRARKLIPFRESIQLFRKRSAFMSDTEIKKIQKGCHSLYDKLWDEVGKDRVEDMPANNQDELKKKVQARESLREKKQPVGKLARFRGSRSDRLCTPMIPLVGDSISPHCASPVIGSR